MKKRRILFFLPFMNGGGAERVVLTLLTHLNREEFEPILVLLRKEGRYLSFIPEDIDVIDLKATQARYAIVKIIKVIREEKPDIVFTTLAYLNLIIAMIRPFFSKKILFIARESNTVSIRNKREKYPKLFNWLYKHVYKNFDLIVTQAKYMHDDLVVHYQIPSSKMKIIYNPVDSAYIDTKSHHDNRLFDNNYYNLLAVGKLGYQKGFDILLSIMTRLDDHYHLTILGEGNDEKKLKSQIKMSGLEGRVSMLGFCDNPYMYMKQADLFVLTSRYEGLPNVVLEANACGIGVVAFDAPGGTVEIVKDMQNGFLVPSFDEVQFAQTIQKAQQHHFDKAEIKRHINEQFSIKNIIQEYEIIFT